MFKYSWISMVCRLLSWHNLYSCEEECCVSVPFFHVYAYALFCHIQGGAKSLDTGGDMCTKECQMVCITHYAVWQINGNLCIFIHHKLYTFAFLLLLFPLFLCQIDFDSKSVYDLRIAKFLYTGVKFLWTINSMSLTENYWSCSLNTFCCVNRTLC
jgi:hypothetical protein